MIPVNDTVIRLDMRMWPRARVYAIDVSRGAFDDRRQRQNPEMTSDESRIALGRVAKLLTDNPEYTLEDLRSLENYEQIPEPVRETIERLTLPERQLLKRIFNTLAQNDIEPLAHTLY
jgi:hypothetical protein